MSGIKVIKFDLPINGIKVKTLDELRDNLSDELLALARSGQLGRWLASRKHEEIAQAVAAAVVAESDDKALFLALCRALGVEVHPDDVAALFDVPPPAGRPLARGAEEPELVVSRVAIQELFDELLRSRLAVWRRSRSVFSISNPDADSAWLCELVSSFDFHIGCERKNYVLVSKDFGWEPQLRIERGNVLKEGDLIASIRNQKFSAPVSGRIRSIGLDGVSLAVLIESTAAKA